MARPVWNGVVSFGLLNVPVQLYTAARNVDMHFRMLDVRNKKPIRYERVNAETGEEVPWKEIVKAYEYSKGNYVVVDEKELRKIAPDATESVDIETFVDQSAIDPMYFEKPYYLLPVKKAEKGLCSFARSAEAHGQSGHRARGDPHAPISGNDVSAWRCAGAESAALSRRKSSRPTSSRFRPARSPNSASPPRS